MNPVRLFTIAVVSTLVFVTNPCKAQVSVGLGLAGMKYLGDGSQRPMAIGLNPNLAFELSDKTKLLLTPSFFIPVTYKYNDQIRVNNAPVFTTSEEQLKTLQASALFIIDIIGNNKSGGLYAGVGPSVVFYNTSVTRANYASYNYAGDFHDYVLDARAGAEIPLGLFRLYGEVELGPSVFSDIKSNNVYYKPHKGTILAGIIGIRIRA